MCVVLSALFIPEEAKGLVRRGNPVEHDTMEDVSESYVCFSFTGEVKRRLWAEG